MKMKKKMILLVSLLLLMAAVLGGMPQDAWADTQSKEYVVDDAGLFTDKEKEQLTKMCRKASDACKTDVVILTQSKGLDDKELENYVRGIINESYGYDESSSEPDAIVYVIDMKSRADMLVTSGIARTTKSFTQSKLDAIREKAEDKLSDGNYYAGCKKYIAGVRKQLDTSLSYRLSLYLPQKLLISLGVAAAAVIAMMFQAKSKMTVDSRTYTRNHNFNVRRREDRFINTTVVTRHIESSSSSGSSGGGGGGGNSGSTGSEASCKKPKNAVFFNGFFHTLP